MVWENLYMDILTFFLSLIIGGIGGYFVGVFLNYPDMVTVVTLSVIGARIVWYLRKLVDKPVISDKADEDER